jgi:hypothetical protein
MWVRRIMDKVHWTERDMEKEILYVVAEERMQFDEIRKRQIKRLEQVIGDKGMLKKIE